ncbi:MAG: glycogen debranching enzyme [Candidatus Peribacteria bacterium]|nr:glycogen debranching enzyme [Candidatus Peribacteria bacterium]
MSIPSNPSADLPAAATVTTLKESVLNDFQKVYSNQYGLFASASPLYGAGIFGRDSLEAAEDVLGEHPEIAETVIGMLARLQGKVHHILSEEEPGRIHHEYRARAMPGREVHEQSLRILEELAAVWGGTPEELCYYGSVDATPLYVTLVTDYCERHPERRTFLDRSIEHRNGSQTTIQESVLSALAWTDQRIQSSGRNLLEFKRAHAHGHINQVWMDSVTSYIHADGSFPNYRQPIAAVEVQGFAYDALLKGAHLFRDTLPQQAGSWLARAEQVRQSTLSSFWMPEDRYFAMGLDVDEHGRSRQIATRSSNAALLLNTSLFDGLPENEHKNYVENTVRRIYSAEFLTEVGLRCRSLDFVNLVDFADYHGSLVSWAKQTYDVSKGLRRQGFPRLAEQLDIRILNGIALAGSPLEFIYIDANGHAHYDEVTQPSTPEDLAADRQVIAGTNIPERMQTWTLSALLAIHYRLEREQTGPPVHPQTWQWRVEEELLARQPLAEHINADQLHTTSRANQAFTVSLEAGKECERRYREILSAIA